MKINENLSYRHISILGGHKLAVSYYDKISNAKAAGQIAYDCLFCITDDPKAYAHEHVPQPDIIAKSYSQFILDTLSDPISVSPHDTIVPDHTAKHVMLQVFLGFVAKYFPSYKTDLKPFVSDLNTPFLYKSENDAIWAMSYATWTCPPDCDEPAICPHIAAPRTWDFFKMLPQTLNSLTHNSSIHLFGCEPLVAEMSHLKLSKIADELKSFKNRLAGPIPVTALIATHSHCHGILGCFEVSHASI